MPFIKIGTKNKKNKIGTKNEGLKIESNGIKSEHLVKSIQYRSLDRAWSGVNC